jgi:salicylate hydroxylase/6-hydroxynicotinate 3-monooxygenase
MKKKLSVAVVGAGMGGLAVAATLRRVGIDVRVYEQAVRFGRIGAGIQMMPNSMKVLRGIGIEERLRKTSFAPYSHLNRDGYTGEVTRELPMPESLYSAPYLACTVPISTTRSPLRCRPKSCISARNWWSFSGPVTLRFEDGTSVNADAVIGADGAFNRARYRGRP